MLASSKDPYGNGFREVEIVEEDKSDFGKYCIGYNPEKVREYNQKIKGTHIHERRKEYWRLVRAKERAAGYSCGHVWGKANVFRRREYDRERKKKSGYNKKRYRKVGKFAYTIMQKSGYKKYAEYLRLRGIKAPKNFTMAYIDRPWLKKGQWAWTFAHP